MSNYGFEVLFRAVGENSTSGDCIVLRFGDFSARDRWILVVVDGGFVGDGASLVEFIDSVWRTKQIDLVIMTHPDGDHAGGLRAILEDGSVIVGELWMHTPWVHDLQLKKSMQAEGVDSLSFRLSANVRKSLSQAQEVHAIAIEREIDVVEPFAGMTAGNDLFKISVLGPCEEFYKGLVEEMEATETVSLSMNSMTKSAGAVSTLQQSATQVAEDWWTETLTDADDESEKPRNNSSVLLLIEATVDGAVFPQKHRVLLTGDAGVPAIQRAIEFAESDLGIRLCDCDLQQVPHHGSQRNVSPAILDQLVGSKKLFDDGASKMIAVVSAAKVNDDGKHPSGAVTNAYMRRGATVHVTAGGHKVYKAGSCPSASQQSKPIPFQTTVTVPGS